MISNETRLAHALGRGVPFSVSFRFTTDGSGVATLTQSHRSQISISKSTNTYTITLPKSWGETDAVHVTHGLYATVNVVETNSPSAKTITLAFSGAIASNTVSVTLFGRDLV